MASRYDHHVDQEFGIQTLIRAGSSSSLNSVEDILRPIYPQTELEAKSEDPLQAWTGIRGPARRKEIVLGKLDRRSIESAIWRETLTQHKLQNVPASPRSPKSSICEDALPERDVTVAGPVIPTQYTAKGLFPHEVPVIGTHIDLSVIPGFRYRVRVLQSGQYLFDGKALSLQSIGMGYGKRLTFQGEALNHNSNYFWSDTYPKGYGFSIDAVRPGERFTVSDQDMRPVGHATIDYLLLPQAELATEIEDGTVEKKVKITFACTVEYFGSHGLLSMHSRETNLELTGVAVLTKYKGAREAVLTCIEAVYLPDFGRCVLNADL